MKNGIFFAIVFSTIIMIGISFTPFAQAESITSNYAKTVSQNTYVNEQYGFSLVPPSGWLIERNPQTEGTVTDVDVSDSGGHDVVVFAASNEYMYPHILVNYDSDWSKEDIDYMKFTSEQQLSQDSEDGMVSYAGIRPDVFVKKYDDGVVTVTDFVIPGQRAADTIFDLHTISVEYFLYGGESYVFNFNEVDGRGGEQKFYDALSTLHFGPVVREAQAQTPDDNGGGCLIATATYGSEMTPQVQFLREIRDNTVMSTQSGASFMTAFNSFYYSFSPTVADLERQNPIFKEMVKATITPLLSSLALLQYVDIDTEEEMLGYGVGIILLNVGMYFVAPVAVLYKIKNRRK